MVGRSGDMSLYDLTEATAWGGEGAFSCAVTGGRRLRLFLVSKCGISLPRLYSREGRNV